ncbi:porin family protein [Flavobacterium sp.]|uniref:porin family protein n=1 Tax=Flavobacterium sp. TaxID=239 RepID=UPI003341EFE2
MKKIILTSFMLCSAFAFSQEIKFGAKVGLNLSNLSGDYPTGIDEHNSKIGFHIGGFAEYEINDKFIIQPELLFSTQGNTYGYKDYYGGGSYYDGADYNLKLNYLNLPIILKYKIIEKLSIDFGPQIGYLMSAKTKIDVTEDSRDPSQNYSVEIDMLNDGIYNFGGTIVQGKASANRFDFSLNIGTSYDITEKIFIQGRYNLGLSTVDKNSTNGESINSWNMKNGVFQLSAGYRF